MDGAKLLATRRCFSLNTFPGNGLTSHPFFKQEIDHFLSADSTLTPVSRLEGLRLVKQSVAKNKDQLVDLVNRTEGKIDITAFFYGYSWTSQW